MMARILLEIHSEMSTRNAFAYILYENAFAYILYEMCHINLEIYFFSLVLPSQALRHYLLDRQL